jgi:putative ABC transport system permease protein
VSTLKSSESNQARALMRPYALYYLYRNRLRVQAAQEVLAGIGIAVAVALVFGTLVASGSIAGSASEVVHQVIGPASLQLRARGPQGFDERLLKRVEALAGVKQAAPILEQTATVVGPDGRRVSVEIAGTDVALATLNGLAHTLPIAALSAQGIGLSRTSATELGVSSPTVPAGGPYRVTLQLRGRAYPLKVSAVLGPEAAGALSSAKLAVMPLAHLQQLSGLRGRVSRIFVQTQPGRQAEVNSELQALAGSTLTVAPADQDIALLHQALRPSDQASAFFAVISALLGFLFAFNAILLTVPERRAAIADLRLSGTKRSAIVQMVLFQALCLGLAASLVGVLGGYLLSAAVFKQSPGYLSQAFVLGTSTVIGVKPVLLSLAGGVLATCVGSSVPLLDLRRGSGGSAVEHTEDASGSPLAPRTQFWLAVGAVGSVALATAMFVLEPRLALASCALLALAIVLAVPLVFAGTLRAGGTLVKRFAGFTSLPVALTSARATTTRSLALCATGAVALFGAVALGGSRDDLLRGIAGYASHYVAAADIWLVNPGDNQATNDFPAGARAAVIARTPGVASVQSFQGGFLDLGKRRVWVIAWPSNSRLALLDGQVTAGSPNAAAARVREGGWVTVSQQIAAERHLAVGDALVLPTPTGSDQLRIAATTTNFGWSSGAIVLNAADYRRSWATAAPTALGVALTPGADRARVEAAIRRDLGPASGLEVLSARAREAKINASASGGLNQLGEIAALLVIAAILAMTAALTSAMWQRRTSLAGMRLSGARPDRLRRVLLLESVLMLGAGCLAGAIAGIYGQVVIDGYLKRVTGFPVASLATSLRPLEIFLIVLAAVLLIAAIPGWVASETPARLALEEE